MRRLRPLDEGKPVTVCVDFDGVIHQYDNWNGPVPTGEPIPGCRLALQRLRENGATVEVFSTRPAIHIKAWLAKHGLDNLVAAVRDGKPYYVAFFDDRAHNVPTNTPGGLLDAVDHYLATQTLTGGASRASGPTQSIQPKETRA